MHWVINSEQINDAPRRVNQAAALCGNAIYSFGGYSKEASNRELKLGLPIDVYVLNISKMLCASVIINDS